MAKAKTPGGRRTTGTKTAAAAQGAATVAVDAPAPKKNVWPSRKETWITSVMVFIMVLIAAAFFWIVDTGLGFASRIILSLGQ